MAVSQNGRRVFTSQLLVKGHPANARDSVVKNLEPRALKTLLVDFNPLPGTKLGELSANFDIVLGVTPNELRWAPCAVSHPRIVEDPAAAETPPRQLSPHSPSRARSAEAFGTAQVTTDRHDPMRVRWIQALPRAVRWFRAVE